MICCEFTTASGYRWKQVEPGTEEAVVYNLHVGDYHTYFVGTREWSFSAWAHNIGPCGPGLLRAVAEGHHLLPTQFADQFARAGLNIKDFVVKLPKDVHRLLPDGWHTGAV